MLQSIRDRAQGWIAWVIVGLISLTFALFGIDQYARGDKVETVAEVNGESITAPEFLTLYNRQKLRLQQQFGDLYDQVIKDEELRTQVLDALIESEQIRQWSNDNRLTISDQQLSIAIQSAQAFQQDGKFSQKIYEEILIRNGLNVGRFEYEQRQFLAENQFKNLTVSSGFSTKSELEQLLALQDQERNISYLRVDQRPFLKTATVSDEAVETFFNDNIDQYVEPEKVSIEYIELSQQALADKVEYTDEILQGFYEENKLQFTTPEKREAKHILILVDAETDEAEQAALKTVAEVEAKIAEGVDFSELAKTYSKDPGSAESGGDLGVFEQGMMVPEFDNAVFSMQVGEVSEPVRTEFGFHIIKLTAIDASQANPFAEVKSEVASMYQSQEAERQYFDVLEQLNTLAYEQPDSLEPAAEAVGLSVQTSPLFSRDGGAGKVLSNTKVINTAFSEEVLKSSMNSASIDIAANHAVIIRLAKHKEARQKPISEVEASIKEQLKREAAIAESAKLGEALMAKLANGEQPQSLMEEGIEWHTVGWIKRDAQNLLPQMVSEAFKTPKPTKDKSSWNQFALVTGDTILMQVTDVRVSQVTAEQTDALNSAFSELFSTAELTARINQLKQADEVVKMELYKTIK